MSATTEDAEHVLIALAEALEGGAINGQDYAPFSAPFIFQRVWELEAEVNNGGFTQFFSNASGRHAPDTPGALRKIGAEQAARIVDAALTVVGHGTPWGDDSRRKAFVEQMPNSTKDALDELDSQFFGYPDNLGALLHQYVVSHSVELAAYRQVGGER